MKRHLPLLPKKILKKRLKYRASHSETAFQSVWKRRVRRNFFLKLLERWLKYEPAVRFISYDVLYTIEYISFFPIIVTKRRILLWVPRMRHVMKKYFAERERSLHKISYKVAVKHMKKWKASISGWKAIVKSFVKHEEKAEQDEFKIIPKEFSTIIKCSAIG